MTAPPTPPPHGISLPVRWKRVIDGDTLEVLLPSGRDCKIRVKGFNAPELPTQEGRYAKHALESLLEGTADEPLTIYIPLPRDKDGNGQLDLTELLAVLSFERVCAYLYAGHYRVDTWMVEHEFGV